MAKAKKPQDATLRNVRASQRRDDRLEQTIASLECVVEEQTARIDALENEVAQLSEDAGRAFVPFGDGDGRELLASKAGSVKDEPTDRNGD